MSTAAAVMIIKAPTTAAPIIVRPASVLTHLWAPGSGLSFIIALIHPLVPSGSPVHHPVLHLPPRADRTAVCGSPRFGRLRFRLLRQIRPFSSHGRRPPLVRRRMGSRPRLPHRPRTVQSNLRSVAAIALVTGTGASALALWSAAVAGASPDMTGKSFSNAQTAQSHVTGSGDITTKPAPASSSSS
jgi:hypothetical protein